MKKYRVLKEYVHPRTGVLITQGYEFNYESEYTNTYIKALEREGFVEEISKRPETIWDLKEGDVYYAIYDDGVIVQSKWGTRQKYNQEARLEIGNIFLTYAEAEKELARRKAKVILERDTKGFKPDWNKIWEKDKQVYSVYCSQRNHELYILYANDNIFSGIWFATEADAKASIETHPNEWKIWLQCEDE